MSGSPIPNPSGGVGTIGSGVKTSGSYGQFIDGTLAKLGIKNPNINVTETLLEDLLNTEGPNSYNNPFNIEAQNTSQAWAGAYNWNNVGVQEYASPAAGEAATAAFLSQNPRWAPLVQALKGNDPNAVNSSLSAIYSSWGATLHTANVGKLNDVAGLQLGSNSKPYTGGEISTNPITGTGEAISKPVVQGVKDAVGGISSVGDFLALLGKLSTWERIGFIILGGLFIVLAVAHMTDGAIPKVISV